MRLYFYDFSILSPWYLHERGRSVLNIYKEWLWQIMLIIYFLGTQFRFICVAHLPCSNEQILSGNSFSLHLNQLGCWKVFREPLDANKSQWKFKTNFYVHKNDYRERNNKNKTSFCYRVKSPHSHLDWGSSATSVLLMWSSFHVTNTKLTFDLDIFNSW